MVVLTVLAPKWKSLPGLLSISLARFILCEKRPYFQPAFRFGLARKETAKMSTVNDHAGLAALSICEALLLALNDSGLLPEHEIVGVLRDAAATHENAVGTGPETERHRSAAALINQIIAGGYSVRWPQA